MLEDAYGSKPVVSSDVPFEGAIWDVRRDKVDLGDAGTVTREYLEHPGAVVVVALDDTMEAFDALLSAAAMKILVDVQGAQA